jgi:RimJ/RimL family protein N-acetyltransferase
VRSAARPVIRALPGEWQALITDPGQRTFGLFTAGELIGITAAFTDRGDPSGRTALLGMSYIAPGHRGRGLTALLYGARLAWVRARPAFQRARVSHRKSNLASRRAIERHGFAVVGHSIRTWPDGATEDEILYALELRDAT